MTLRIKRFRFAQQYRLIHARCVQEYDIGNLNVGFRFLEILRYVLLQEFFICATHLGADAGHDVGALVFVQLPAPLLLAADVLRVRLRHHHFVAFENLEEEFSSVTQDKDPGLYTPG